MLKLCAIPLLAIFVLASVCHGQDRTALTQILKSEKDAAKLVDDLQSYASKSPWDIEVTSILAQRLAVKGLNASQIMRTITASGDMAAALDADDEKFAGIVWLTGLIVKAESPAPLLYNLESLGVPAFDLLAETLSRSEQEIRKLAQQDRLRSEGVFGLLTLNYSTRYKGMAEKLALKRRGNR